MILNPPAFVLRGSSLLFLVLFTVVAFSFFQLHESPWSAPWEPPTKYTGYKRPGFEAPLANGIPLRIMGLGASTVFGAESFDQTGWRRTLRQRLVRAGNPVNFVGAARTGGIVDNDVEAYPGVRLDQIYDHATKSLPLYKPNIVILYAGSNDNFQNASLPELYKRYYAVAEHVFTASPRATLVMGTLMPTTETKKWGGQDRVGTCNTQLRRVFQVLKREGKPVVLVEMGDDDGVQIENLAWDHMHPSKAGYEIMSRKFFEAIVEADAKGFLQPPDRQVSIEIPDDGESTRMNDELRKKRQEEDKKKKDEEEAENAAVLAMIEELRVNPWDGQKPYIPPKKEDQ
ncbi:hypothetical protein LZ554_001776 [Drepanopeziza brunnea f. sp. 'monogermtubi']|nr:hypothetical protein LZ554_001776 [Drepanopeziza brunnea f. sp. 'monogermtubi']